MVIIIDSITTMTGKAKGSKYVKVKPKSSIIALSNII